MADILLWRCLLQDPTCIGLMVLPFVALVREKEQTVKKVGELLGKRVASFYHGSPAKFDDQFDVAIATIEKAASFISQRLALNSTQKSIGIAIIDEFHIFHTGQRGEILENVLIKIQLANLTHSESPDVSDLVAVGGNPEANIKRRVIQVL